MMEFFPIIEPCAVLATNIYNEDTREVQDYFSQWAGEQKGKICQQNSLKHKQEKCFPYYTEIVCRGCFEKSLIARLGGSNDKY